MQWTREFYFGKSGLRKYIGEIASAGSKPTWRHSVKSILIRAEQDQLTGVTDLSPAWLGSFRRPDFLAKRDQDERKIFGRLLEKRGIWSVAQYELFENNLRDSVSRWQIRSAAASSAMHRATPNPPQELCAVVSALAMGCGLSTGEMKGLRVNDLRSEGLVVSPSRLIPFGEERDQLSKGTLDRFIAQDRPTGYLFFSKSPRDHHKPLSRQTLNAAVRTLHPKHTVTSLVERHFQEDFDCATNLQCLWSHWSNVHAVSDDHIRRLLCGRRRQKRAPAINGYVNEAAVFPVPAPYLLAAICASGCIPQSSKLLQGGERRLSLFRLLERYDIAVEWPRSLFEELSSMEGRPGRQRAERALRLLYKFAWEHWLAGQRSQVKHIGRRGLWANDRDLVDRFALTDVHVVDRRSGTEWSRRLFEFQSQKHGFTVPLIEQMIGGAYRGKCVACWHPRRGEVDREILAAVDRKEQLVKEERFVNELTAIAEKFGGGLSYQSLRRHAGLNPPVPGRGTTRERSGHSRSHIAKASAAPVTRCPRTLVNRLESLERLPLILQGLLLATGTEKQEVSVAWIQQAGGPATTDSEISLALNALCQSPAILKSFEGRPQQRFLTTISRDKLH